MSSVGQSPVIGLESCQAPAHPCASDMNYTRTRSTQSLATAALLGACLWVAPHRLSAADASMTTRAQTFIQAHVAKLQPLEKAAALAWWDANISGKDDDFKRKEETQNQIDAALADR